MCFRYFLVIARIGFRGKCVQYQWQDHFELAGKVCRFLLDSKGEEFFPLVCHFCVSSDITKVLWLFTI